MSGCLAWLLLACGGAAYLDCGSVWQDRFVLITAAERQRVPRKTGAPVLFQALYKDRRNQFLSWTEGLLGRCEKFLQSAIDAKGNFFKDIVDKQGTGEVFVFFYKNVSCSDYSIYVL